MRVALLSMNARAGDAVGRQVAEKAAAFLDRGAAVTVVVEDDRDLHPALVPFTLRLTTPALTGPAGRALADADLIVVELTQFYSLLEVVPLIADGRRKLIVDYHGLTPPAEAPPHLRDALLRGEEWRGVTSLADATIVHSRFTARELGRPSYRLPLPVEPPPAPVRSTIRERFGIPDGPLLLFVGRLAPNKRLPTLLRALAQLDSPRPRLAVIGPCHDAYEAERVACQELAADLGVAERVHFLGCVEETVLADAYYSADALVIPSCHEGFGLPAVEAMACGLPVIVARAGALAETIGDAGLTFAVDDPADLARQIRRLLSSRPAEAKCITKVAIVIPRHGDRAGGAERSLTRLALGLHEAGYTVQVFATADDSSGAPYPVHVHPAIPRDEDRREAAVAGTGGEAQYWQNTLRSPALVAAVAAGSFDAVIVGPYLTGLTRDIVRAVGDRTVLVPCLHNETEARFAGVRQMFETAGGVLYHSEAERELSHAEFGFNHINEAVLGAFINTTVSGDGGRGRNRVGCERYVAYCGRLVAEKNLDQLFDFARRYDREHPGRLRFAFMGDGPMAIPAEPWARRLGHVSEDLKRDVMAGALALVLPSSNESLSLAVLEANAQATPALVNGGAAVLVDYVALSGGGLSYAGYDEFAQSLDAIFAHPSAAKAMGARGREYVEATFGNPRAVVARAEQVMRRLGQPLAEALRDNGRRRAAEFSRANWRKGFDRVVEAALERAGTLDRANIEMTSRQAKFNGPVGTLVIKHRGGRPLAPSGPARSEIVLRLRHGDGELTGYEWTVPIREWVTPGSAVISHIPLPSDVPAATFVVEAALRHHGIAPRTEWYGPLANWTSRPDRLQLEPATEDTVPEVSSPATAHLDGARAIQTLPDGYVDVTLGVAARLKRWLKRKLLHNFRAGYVDVLSRQQSRFNRRLLDAMDALAVSRSSDVALHVELAETRRRCEDLERRLARLERGGQRGAPTRQEAA